MIPKATTILGHEDIMGFEYQKSLDDLIEAFPKDQLAVELAGINNLIRPRERVNVNSSIDLQMELLQTYCSDLDLFQKMLKVISDKKYYWTEVVNDIYNPVIFSRQTCLTGIEYVLNSDLEESNENFQIRSPQNSKLLILFLLALNDIITKTKDLDENDFDDKELLNAVFIPLNEMIINSDVRFQFYKGFRLVEYFKSSKYKLIIEEYFDDNYGTTGVEFIQELLKISVHKSSTDINMDFVLINEDETKEQFFDKLSNRSKGYDKMQLVALKKSPLYKGNKEYYILDRQALVNKSYYQLINDIWFDCLKQKNHRIEEYRGEIGLFNEDYFNLLFSLSFVNYKHIVSKTSNDLIVKKGKQNIELCDFYLRDKNKLIIGEVKSSSIYDNEKLSGDMEKLYRNDRANFFKTFGVDQIVQSIVDIDLAGLVDPKYNAKSMKDIFPVVVASDPVFQSEFMSDIFNNRFQELISSIPVNKKRYIRPLTLMHINDWELLQPILRKNPKTIWTALKLHLKNANKKNDIINPFYYTVEKILDKDLLWERQNDTLKEILEIQ